MLKRLWIAALAALLVTLSLSGVALAATGTNLGVGNRFGKVTAIGTDRFTIENFAGKSKTILVNSSTRFYGINGVIKSFSAVRKNLWVEASGAIDAKRDLVAHAVILMASSEATGAWNHPRLYGKVTAVNAAGSAFTLTTKNREVTVTVNSGTKFVGKVSSLSLVKVGMNAAVAGMRVSHTALTATAVDAFTPTR